nr:DNA-directed RNA polymerase III subunit [Fagopyrum tataricum]
MVPIATSEFKVYDYLVETAACDQTEEIIDEFLKKSEPFNLAKAEILNIINVRPSTPAQIYPIIEKADERLGEEKLDELADMISQVLPAAPGDVEIEEEEGAEEEANADEDKATDEQMEEAS